MPLLNRPPIRRPEYHIARGGWTTRQPTPFTLTGQAVNSGLSKATLRPQSCFAFIAIGVRNLATGPFDTPYMVATV